ncbi:hypothetical protein MKW98_023330 [Papaver atlanticum]|uniref:PLAT domain-containing protein n=1 Tax=Papaver atlanticum TaxID=357466 RepID=A0AAD4T9P7_9MAGN|nr:hypothetical protein MKW98_023330 [Papaver atlanticum]
MAFAINSLSLVFFGSLLFSFAVLTQQSYAQLAVTQSSVRRPFPTKVHIFNDCVYTVYTKTGTRSDSGTDSNISLELYDSNGNHVEIPNLGDSGLMGPDHDYFENGNLDISSALGKCLPGPVCGITLTSDGTKAKSGWYVDYVQVIVTGPNASCAQKLFTIEQWLALDESPHALTVTKNVCVN